jgi:hypothetical protein
MGLLKKPEVENLVTLSLQIITAKRERLAVFHQFQTTPANIKLYSILHIVLNETT